MTLLQALILQCLHRINGERTIYSVYHLLTGKKSSQTIQDAHLYQLSHLFKTMPGFKRRQFNECIAQLQKDALITFKSESTSCIVNEKGIEQYINHLRHINLTYMNGWKYQDTSVQMWKRLQLLVQAVSHLVHDVRLYYPVVRDVDTHDWIKRFLLNYSGTRTELSECLITELFALFAKPFPDNPDLIVARLSGWKMVGLTAEQTAEKMNIEKTEYIYRFINSLHYIVQTVVANEQKYTIMNSLISDTYQRVPYTNSTRQTYVLLQENLTIEQIANRRGLKPSTIEDHIIEIAINDPNFSIDAFVDPAIARKISLIAKELGVKKLKPIKEKVDAASYFQIRLVLAKSGVNL